MTYYKPAPAGPMRNHFAEFNPCVLCVVNDSRYFENTAFDPNRLIYVTGATFNSTWCFNTSRLCRRCLNYIEQAAEIENNAPDTDFAWNNRRPPIVISAAAYFFPPFYNYDIANGILGRAPEKFENEYELSLDEAEEMIRYNKFYGLKKIYLILHEIQSSKKRKFDEAEDLEYYTEKLIDCKENFGNF